MTIHAIGLTTLSNTAKDFRNDMSALLFGATSTRPTGARSGVRWGTKTDTVSLVAFAGTIKPHSGVMDVQTAAAAGPYFYAVTANETFTVSAAHATLPRVDIVTIRINDDVEDSSGLESATTHYKAGTAAASPVAPSPDTTRDMIIATIAVPASGGGNPVASWVAPYAVAGGGIVPIRTATELAALWLAYPPTTDAPVITTRKDAAAGKIIEYSVDGANKYVVDARLSTDPDPLAVRAAYNFRPANAAALSALAGTYTLRADDKAFQVDTGVEYRYSGSAWIVVDAYVLFRKASPQTIASGSEVTIDLDATPTDIRGTFSESSGVVTMPHAGNVLLTGHVIVEAGGSPSLYTVRIYKNSNPVVDVFQVASAGRVVFGAGMTRVAAGDTITLKVSQNSGANKTVGELNSDSPILLIQYVSI